MPERREYLNIHGSTRQECCDKLAIEFMQRNALIIAKYVVDLGIHESKEFEYLIGFQDGYAMCMERILSGAVNLREIAKNLPESEQSK